MHRARRSRLVFASKSPALLAALACSWALMGAFAGCGAFSASDDGANAGDASDNDRSVVGADGRSDATTNANDAGANDDASAVGDGAKADGGGGLACTSVTGPSTLCAGVCTLRTQGAAGESTFGVTAPVNGRMYFTQQIDGGGEGVYLLGVPASNLSTFAAATSPTEIATDGTNLYWAEGTILKSARLDCPPPCQQVQPFDIATSLPGVPPITRLSAVGTNRVMFVADGPTAGIGVLDIQAGKAWSAFIAGLEAATTNGTDVFTLVNGHVDAHNARDGTSAGSLGSPSSAGGPSVMTADCSSVVRVAGTASGTQIDTFDLTLKTWTSENTFVSTDGRTDVVMDDKWIWIVAGGAVLGHSRLGTGGGTTLMAPGSPTHLAMDALHLYVGGIDDGTVMTLTK
jgi:hypothetical protein